MALLTVKELVLHYAADGGPVRAVDSVSFEISGQGEALGIIGESGSGKTTMVNALTRMLPPNVARFEGEITFDGIDLMRLSDEAFRREIRWKRIAVVFQGSMSAFNPVIKIGPQVAERLLVDGMMTKTEAYAEVVRLLETVGLGREVFHRYPHELSGGMKQRAAIAMALSMKPDLLILDEPTSALDVSVQAQVMNLLKQLKWDRGISMIFITHDIALASDISDQILVIQHGKVCEAGPADEVLRRPQHPYTKRLLASVPPLRTGLADGAARFGIELGELAEAAGFSVDGALGASASGRLAGGDEWKGRRASQERAEAGEPAAGGSEAGEREAGVSPAGGSAAGGQAHSGPAASPRRASGETGTGGKGSAGAGARQAGAGAAETGTAAGGHGASAAGGGLESALGGRAAAELSVRGPLVAVENLRVYFPVRRGLLRRAAVKAVDGVTLSIRPGETVAVVGESGSGKTTLGRATLGLVKATGGRVTFDGMPVDSLAGADQKRFRRRAQAVFQDPYASMSPFMTVREIVEEPLVVHGIGDSRKAREETVHRALEQVNLTPAGEFAAKYPHNLSGGQRQRVSIARALVLDPEYIVADEPVSMIDASSRSEILALMRRLQEQKGIAFMYITHDIASARHFADRIAIMYLGSIAEQGPADAVIERPLHPYAKALLETVPQPDPDNRRRLRPVIPGEPPSAVDVPPGCPFAARCAEMIKGACDVVRPAPREVEPGRWVACHLYEGAESGE